MLPFGISVKCLNLTQSHLIEQFSSVLLFVNLLNHNKFINKPFDFEAVQ